MFVLIQDKPMFDITWLMASNKTRGRREAFWKGDAHLCFCCVDESKCAVVSVAQGNKTREQFAGGCWESEKQNRNRQITLSG